MEDSYKTIKKIILQYILSKKIIHWQAEDKWHLPGLPDLDKFKRGWQIGGEGHENNDKLLCGRKSALIDTPLEGGFVGCGPAIELQIQIPV